MSSLSGRLIFGTGSLHHLFTSQRRQKVLSMAFDIGFRKFDTAPAYGNGINEYELGIALKGKRIQCEINTKYGIPVPMYNKYARYLFHSYKIADKIIGKSAKAYKIRKFDVNELSTSVEKSLARLQTDYIDTLFIHEPLLLLTKTELEEIYSTFCKLKNDGKVRYLGAAGIWESINKIQSLENFNVIQTRLEDFNMLVENQFSRIIAYSIYNYYRKRNISNSFNDFIREILNANKQLELIFSATTLNNLEKVRELF